MLSDQYSRDTIYYYCTLELGYPAGTSSLFEIAEINNWIDEFEWIACQAVEPTWGTATATISTGTLLVSALTTATTCLRLGHSYYAPGGTNTSTYLLEPRDRGDLDLLQYNWQTSTSGLQPQVIYPLAEGTFGIWPVPVGTGKVIAEFPTYPNFADAGTALVPLPPWTRFGAPAYVGWRFFSRFGPAQDLPRAAVYRRLHEHNLQIYRTLADSFFPQKGARLRPAGAAQARVLNPRRSL